ncbi:MAG TPA: MarR family winged helix-turn-helix transcriptional regulator [Methylocella sp.]
MGLARLASVMRADARRSSALLGLNPAQDEILRHLLVRPAGARVSFLAAQLGVSQPTITDSVIALERKGLVSRQADPEDARAIIVKAAPDARPHNVMEVTSHAATALASLSDIEQIRLLRMLIKLSRNLQLQGAVPSQRLCITCKYFRPNAHQDAGAPHHCDFVDAPFGDRALRLDCAEHAAATPAETAHNWEIFEAHQQEIRP